MGIADELNKRGFRTRKGLEFKHSAVQTILNNEDVYRGRYRYGKSGNAEGQHEPIITEDSLPPEAAAVTSGSAPVKARPGKIQLSDVGPGYKDDYHEYVDEF